jgi:hypothetical protein
VRRLSLGLVDQVLSSVSNVLVVFAVAGVSTVAQFGTFAIAFLCMNASVAVTRGLICNHVALSAGDHHAVMREGGHALSGALCAGVVAALLFGIVGLVWPGLANVVFPLAVAAPIVLAQDVTRFVAMADARPVVACISDGLWAAVSFVVIGAVWAGPGLDAPGVLVLWGAGAALSLAFAVQGLGLRLRCSGLVAWFGDRLRHRLSLAADSLLSVVSTLIVLGAAGHFIGVAAVAALQGAASAFGPVALTLRSIPIAVVPEIRRRGLKKPRTVWPFMSKIAWPLSALSVALGVGSLLVPTRIGEFILGESWNVVAPILPLTGMEWAMIVWMGAATGALQSLDRPSEVLKIRLLFLSLAVVLGTTSALISGRAAGVATALCVAALGAALYARRRLLRDATEPMARTTGEFA